MYFQDQVELFNIRGGTIKKIVDYFDVSATV